MKKHQKISNPDLTVGKTISNAGTKPTIDAMGFTMPKGSFDAH